MPDPSAAKPLAGLRVLELARILAGPWAGQLLADLGADVIKVERKGAGDDTRAWGPPFVPAADGGHLSAAYFHSANRGKRSIEADFTEPEGQRIVKKLVSQSDIVIENFKVGGLKKFGLDYASLAPDNPRLIYCSVTGFGQTGPSAERAGYDLMAQGIGGMMGLTGTADGEPMRVGVAVSDIFSGVYATVGILAALERRHHTGKGGYVDAALVDSTVGVLSFQALNYLVSGQIPKRIGNTHPNLVPYQVFPVADGRIIIATGNDSQFVRLVGILGDPQLADVPDYKDNKGRLAKRPELVGRLSELTSRFSREDLLTKLESAGIPAGPINDLEQVFGDPQVVHRGMRLELKSEAAKGGVIPGIRSPVTLDGVGMASERPAPRLGEHTAEILREIGEE
ncbi:MAG TPA: CaiB/BaiF CoA-transferase family protein [Xanthobacteraceae bacterium]|jgi:crotonobetainyl-CoA:carnitine CoA-transferase CaiB-like acyl-CoA transferase|nr:CaiB/BaiF CoA-transferase family protein [Xanthobacteraceae bacterium]